MASHLFSLSAKDVQYIGNAASAIGGFVTAWGTNDNGLLLPDIIYRETGRPYIGTLPGVDEPHVIPGETIVKILELSNRQSFTSNNHIVREGKARRLMWHRMIFSQIEKIDLGELKGKAWWEVPLPKCPICGGDLIWWEAGYVPGTRMCAGSPISIVDDPLYPDGKRRSYDATTGCKSLYSVSVIGDRVILRMLGISEEAV